MLYDTHDYDAPHDEHAPWDDHLCRFLDGELARREQPALFAHLADCEECRAVLDGTLAFRRASRQEVLTLPPAADEAFFERLASHRASARRVDRAAERRPLWQARRRVSARSAVAFGCVLFALGMLWRMPEADPARAVFVETERVVLDEELPSADGETAPIYVFYPGIEVSGLRTP